LYGLRNERQVLDLALVQVASEIDLARIDNRAVGGNLDDLVEAADGQGEIYDSRLSGCERDPGLLELLEARELGAHPVGAELQQLRAIDAAGVGDDDALGARLEILDRDGNPGKHRAGVVDDDPFDRAVGGL